MERYFLDDKWRRDAACRDVPPDVFFPQAATTGRNARIDIESKTEVAKNICRACPVQQACLEFALTTNQEAGVWGGRDEEERRQIRRNRRLRSTPKSPTKY